MGIESNTEFEAIINGTLTAIGQTVDISGPNGSTTIVQLSGTWSGTIAAEVSVDGTNFISIPSLNQATLSMTANITVNGAYIITTAGYVHIRLRTTNWISGTATIAAYGSDAVTTAAVHSQKFSYNFPDPACMPVGSSPLTSDEDGRLETHSTVLTDMGTFRDDFSGTSMYTSLTGTLNFINGSPFITGAGTLFSTEIKRGQFIRKSSDTPGETTYFEVKSVESDVALTLDGPYIGTTASGVATIVSNWLDYSGTAPAISNSIVTLSSGTAAGFRRIERENRYPPYRIQFKAAVSQRIANQTIRIGAIGDTDADSSAVQACVVFDGTDDTKVKLRVASSTASADMVEIICNLTGGLRTSNYLTYELDLTKATISLIINNKILAQVTDHVPDPYAVLEIAADITNSTTVTNTDIKLDYFFYSRTNRIEVKNSFVGEPIPAQMYGTVAATGLPTPLQLDENGNLIVTAVTGFNSQFTFGDVATASGTLTALRRTAYAPQSTNGQRSFDSSSANDAAAGTGAQQVKITYLDQTGAGPYTEVVTLNGTSRVNTVASNICFIERMLVTRVGSGLTTAGTITLYTLPTTGGTAIGTIAPGEDQTFWAHHYTPIGKTTKITGIQASNDQTAGSSFTLVVLRSKPLNLVGAVESQVSDTIKLYGGSSAIVRSYGSPISIVGPARSLLYCTPSANSNQNTYGSFDFFEP